jgi:hypothetical protein
MTKVTVAGKLNCPDFHRCLGIANALRAKGVTVQVDQFFECQWEQHHADVVNHKKGAFFGHSKKQPLVYLNDEEYIGGCD